MSKEPQEQQKANDKVKEETKKKTTQTQKINKKTKKVFYNSNVKSKLFFHYIVCIYCDKDSVYLVFLS